MCSGAKFCRHAYRTVVRGLRLANKPTISRSEFDMCIYRMRADPVLARYAIMVIGWCASTRTCGYSGPPPSYQACLR